MNLGRWRLDGRKGLLVHGIWRLAELIGRVLVRVRNHQILGIFCPNLSGVFSTHFTPSLKLMGYPLCNEAWFRLCYTKFFSTAQDSAHIRFVGTVVECWLLGLVFWKTQSGRIKTLILDSTSLPRFWKMLDSPRTEKTEKLFSIGPCLQEPSLVLLEHL